MTVLEPAHSLMYIDITNIHHRIGRHARQEEKFVSRRDAPARLQQPDKMTTEPTSSDDVHIILLCTDDADLTLVDTTDGNRRLSSEASSILLQHLAATTTTDSDSDTSVTTSTAVAVATTTSTLSRATIPHERTVGSLPDHPSGSRIEATARDSDSTTERPPAQEGEPLMTGSVLVRRGDKRSDNGQSVVQMVVMPYCGDGEGDERMDEEEKDTTAPAREDGAGSDSEDAAPSVLRALLQASDRQVKMYQAHTHPAEQRGEQVAAASTRLAVAPATASANEGRRLERELRKEESRSEIRALLLGQPYQRVVPPTCVVSPSDVVDLTCRRQEVAGNRDSPPPAKRARVGPAPPPRLVQQRHSLSPFLADAVDLIAEFGDLTYSVQSGRHFSSLEVRRHGLFGIPAPGMTPAQVLVEDSGRVLFQVVATVSTVTVDCMDEDFRLVPTLLGPLLHRLSIRGGHVFCPGVSHELAAAAPLTKNLVRVDLSGGETSRTSAPHRNVRHQAHHCPVWHPLGQHQSWLPINEGIHRCKACKGLERYLKLVRKSKRERGGALGREAERGQDAAGDEVLVDNRHRAWEPEVVVVGGEQKMVIEMHH